MAREYLKSAIPQTPEDLSQVVETAAEVIEKVRREGDGALYELTEKYDRCKLKQLAVSEEDFAAAEKELPRTLKEDMDFGINQVINFAKAQRETLAQLDDAEIYPGIHLGHRIVPVGNVGAYVPGGRYPILSAAQMLVIPAKVAGVPRVIGCTPPRSEGRIHPAVLYALKQSGVDSAYCVGGIQAIAAMAYGTETIRKVDKIVGPGNKYVDEAKRQVNGVVGLDLPAGPSEVLVIADHTGKADIIAADLLAQLEHDPNARAVLVTTERSLGLETVAEVTKQLGVLPTADVASISWKNQGEVIVVDSLEEAVDFSEEWAPEHLEIHTKYPHATLSRLHNYGSCFVGVEAAVVFADKVAGTNHALPTGGAGRYTGGVWVGTFLKWITHQWVSPEAMQLLGEITLNQSTVEGMVGHGESAAIRLRKKDQLK